ncbi:MAG: hypothetical protein DLM55_04345 [Acidimicrobiales bacterium]|nr:MAG: hypothetical protein DLM55_04345 [Acidimicrobiales bacterium]
MSAFLSWGARIAGWIDNAYGVDADPYHQGPTPRFRCVWRRAGWVGAASTVEVAHHDHARLRRLLRDGAQITRRRGDFYLVEQA